MAYWLLSALGNVGTSEWRTLFSACISCGFSSLSESRPQVMFLRLRVLLCSGTSVFLFYSFVDGRCLMPRDSQDVMLFPRSPLCDAFRFHYDLLNKFFEFPKGSYMLQAIALHSSFDDVYSSFDVVFESLGTLPSCFNEMI